MPKPTPGYVPQVEREPRHDAPKAPSPNAPIGPESLVGRVFGLLDVVETMARFVVVNPRTGQRGESARYRCRCRGCGTHVSATSSELLSGKYRTCGSMGCRATLRGMA